MVNATISKFGYPQTLVHEYERWVVMVRPAQVTVGSLVLASREDATRLPELSAASLADLKQVSSDLEAALAGAFQHDKINYLMLMMVDPHVHYHVIPRYAAPVRLNGRTYRDAFWPGPPDVTRALELADGELTVIQERIAASWPAEARRGP